MRDRSGRRDRTITRRWIEVLLFAAATALALNSLLRGFADFGIYVQAARELVPDGPDLYRPHQDHGSYPYPHVVVLVLRAPLLLFGETAVRVLYSLSLGLAAVLMARDLARLVPMPAWRWALLAFLFGRCITENLRHGQLSLWVAACTLRGLRLALERRELAGGTWLGAAAAMKLTPILLAPVLVLLQRPRAAVALLAAAATLVVLVPWPFVGTAEHLRHLRQFSDAMIAPLWRGGGEQAVWGSSSASVRGTLDYLLQPRPRDAAGQDVFALAALDDRALAAVRAAWSGLLLALGAFGWWRAATAPESLRFLLRASVVLLLLALLAPLTRPYHLASIALPAALFCALGPGRGAARGAWFATAVLFALALPLRQKALLGRTLWRALDYAGTLHFALVGLLLWIAAFAPKIAARDAAAAGATPLDRDEAAGAGRLPMGP